MSSYPPELLHVATQILESLLPESKNWVGPDWHPSMRENRINNVAEEILKYTQSRNAAFETDLKEFSLYDFENIPEIMDELRKARTKFPAWPTDPLHAVAVLGEEFGEVTKALLELTYEPHKTSREEARKEIIQCAAMTLRLLRSFDRYEFIPAKQHSQL